MEEIEEIATPVTCVNTKETLSSPKVICSVSKLHKLIGTKCHQSNCSGTYKLNFETCGCCLLIQGSCDNGHSFCWTSSDIVHSSSGKKVYSDNLNVASAIVLSGNSFNKIELFFNFIKTKCFQNNIFHIPAVIYLSIH